MVLLLILLEIWMTIYAGEFDDVLDRSSKLVSEPSEEIQLVYHSISSHVLESNGSMPKDKHQRLLDIENLTLQTPSKATLVRDLKLVVSEMDHLLVSELFLFICLWIFIMASLSRLK